MSDNNTMPTVEFKIAPAMEAVTAMAAATKRRREHEENEREQHPEHPEINKWLEEADTTMSPFLRADLELVFSTETVLIFLYYFIIENRLFTVEEFITGLEELSGEEFLSGFRDRLLKSTNKEDWLSVDEIEKVLEKDRAQEIVPFKEEAEMLVDLLSAAEDFRLRIIEVIKTFYNRYLKERMSTARGHSEEHAQQWTHMLREDPEQCLDRLSSGNFETLIAGASKITLFPVFYDFNETTILMPGDVYFIYGIGYGERALRRDRRERTDELVKAIGDPNRLSILRLLRFTSLYGKEIADKLGISPATASYHIDKLVKTELIRIENPEGRRFYYTVNPKGIEELIASIQTEFLGE